LNVLSYGQQHGDRRHEHVANKGFD
jgi:hypothetical protein